MVEYKGGAESGEVGGEFGGKADVGGGGDGGVEDDGEVGGMVE